MAVRGAAGAYCIWVVSPAGYAHSRAFDDVAVGLRDAFAELGYIGG